mgnify:CR=1 FL=1
MKTQFGTIYICDHCGRKSTSKSGMTLHEKCCSKNPCNDTLCKICVNCEKEEYYTEEHGKIVDFICLINHDKMYSPKVNRMKSSESIKERCDRQMATKQNGCKFFKENHILSKITT